MFGEASGEESGGVITLFPQHDLSSQGPADQAFVVTSGRTDGSTHGYAQRQPPPEHVLRIIALAVYTILEALSSEMRVHVRLHCVFWLSLD